MQGASSRHVEWLMHPAGQDHEMDTPLLSDWDEESEGSLVLDQELQEAFSQVLLKPGLSVVLERPKKAVNDANGLKQCLAEFKRDLERVERLDVTLGPVPEVS